MRSHLYCSREGSLEKLDALRKGLPATRELFEWHAEDAGAARALQEATAFLRSARAYARVSRRPSVAGFLRASKMVHEDSATIPPTGTRPSRRRSSRTHLINRPMQTP